jgi:A1 cistron-splicing factor AAR2
MDTYTNLNTARNKATLLLTSIPSNSYIGIDLSSFTIPATFKGIKHLPPGLHHIWLSPAPSLSLRTGHWIHIAAPTTIHYYYSSTIEDLLQDDDTHPTITSEMWTHALAPYRQRLPSSGSETSSSAAWDVLTSRVTPIVLSRLFRGSSSWHVGTMTPGSPESSLDTEGIDELNPLLGGGVPEEWPISFTPIDLKRTWPTGAVGRERTEKARDRSWALRHMGGDLDVLLGEWQVAFVEALYVGNYACVRQWRRIVELVLTCREAVVDAGGGIEWLFVEFLAALKAQVEVVFAAGEGGGFLVEEMQGVEKLLRAFGKVLREEEDNKSGGREVREEFERLAKWAEKECDWILDTRYMLRKGAVQTEEGDMIEIEEEGLDGEEETGEYAPAIVGNVELMELVASAGRMKHSPRSRSKSPQEIQIVDPKEEQDPRL